MLSACLALVLTACSGGLLPTRTPAPSPAQHTAAHPSATPAASAATTATAAPSPAATGDGSGTSAAPTWLAAADAPEVADGLLPPAERERYLQLMDALRARDELAADWAANTGLFLRDARLDGDELQLLNTLLAGKGDPLWHLTHIRTMLGVDSRDVEYLASIVPAPAGNWYFADDLKGLEAFELLSKEGQRSLQRIFAKAQQDPEVRLGLYLINILGLPDPRAFRYPVPAHNVQLHLLAHLLEQGVPGDYERAAVAAALTYGSLLTVCDEPGREQVLAYAGERVRLLIETDVLLAAAGADWLAKEYPLEALMVLLWGGLSAIYPEPGQPLAQARALDEAATERPLTTDDLARLLTPPAVLRQMQDQMMRAVIERSTRAERACDLVEEWWSANRCEEPDDGGPDSNRQWMRFRDGRAFSGGAEAGYVLQALAASVNLPLPWAQLWYAQEGRLRRVPFGLRLDTARRTLRLGATARGALDKLPPETTAVLLWWRLPWDNWHVPTGSQSWQTMPLPLAAWRRGIPAGYLLRLNVATEEEALAALGIAPNPAPAKES